jgi:alpha-galactosidase
MQGRAEDYTELVSALGDWGRKWRYPRNEVSEGLLVEWNHWCPYTDKSINENIFMENVTVAKEMGMEICCLDAGWFGLPPSGNDFWVGQRGNWDVENIVRFPHGIAWLSEQIHALGMKFGIWCEIEAVGEQALIAEEHPNWVACRKNRSLGYLCMGNPHVTEWAFAVLEKLIVHYHADWIKIDFNLNPGFGCDRLDHGHGAGDGLYEHYQGLYGLLDKVRDKHPHVMLENCSSGGFRIDLGMMGHMHKSYLSDDDYPDHALQVLWGAAGMLHPSACIHWAWSQTEEQCTRNGINNPYRVNMENYQLDFIIRIALLKCTGFSWKLNELDNRYKKRVSDHISYYKQIRYDYIRDGRFFRLTGQALRDGSGDRWNAYQFLHRDGLSALIFVFRLYGAEESRKIWLHSLCAEVMYSIADVDNDQIEIVSGEELTMIGFMVTGMRCQSSRIYLIHPVDD